MNNEGLWLFAFVIAICTISSCATKDKDGLSRTSVNPEVTCLHGVQYYVTTTLGNGVVGEALAPKYTSGSNVPDRCNWSSK